MILVLRSERWITAGWRGVPDVVLARDRSPAVRTVTVVLHGLITLTLLFFAFTWLVGSWQWGPVKLGNPIRQLQNGTILVVLAILVRHTTGDIAARRRTAAALSWFLAGIAPAVIHLLRGGSLRLTATHSDDGHARSQSSRTRSPARPGSGMHWATRSDCRPGRFSDSCSGVGRDSDRDSGDARGQRARERGPAEGCVSRAGGVLRSWRPGGRRTSRRGVEPASDSVFRGADGGARGAIVWLWKRSRVVATGLTVWMLLGFVWSEYRWYRQLQPDDSSPALLQCLEDRHRYFATADYDDAYRLTFLSNERVIVVPDKGHDRFPPYRRSSKPRPTGAHRTSDLRRRHGSAGRLLCRTPLLMARRIPK